MQRDAVSPARERVLSVAEQLFSERGYKAVTLRDIAEALGIRQASLYHHFPGGKEELFVEVTERGLERHREALQRAIDEAGPDLRSQLQAAARWLLSQPPVDMNRMVRSDMPAISEPHAHRLTQAAFRALLAPLDRAFIQARDTGAYAIPSETLLSGSFLSIIEGIQLAERFSPMSREQMADEMIQVLLNGLRRRQLSASSPR